MYTYSYISCSERDTHKCILYVMVSNKNRTEETLQRQCQNTRAPEISKYKDEAATMQHMTQCIYVYTLILMRNTVDTY